jgi:Tfp pilus assembly protein PilE
MGQQQLLLVILVTILVGIATVVAINTMQESRVNANHDAVRQVMLDASTRAQGYYIKHESMGGGGKSFQNITMEVIEVEPDNEHGTFSITDSGTDSFTITAIPAAGGDNIVGVVYADSIEFVDP